MKCQPLVTWPLIWTFHWPPQISSTRLHRKDWVIFMSCSNWAKVGVYKVEQTDCIPNRQYHHSAHVLHTTKINPCVEHLPCMLCESTAQSACSKGAFPGKDTLPTYPSWRDLLLRGHFWEGRMSRFSQTCAYIYLSPLCSHQVEAFCRAEMPLLPAGWILIN